MPHVTRIVLMAVLVGCRTSSPYEIAHSDRGPDMVKVPAATVRLGLRRTPPVDGFTWGSGASPGGTPGPQGPLPVPQASGPNPQGSGPAPQDSSSTPQGPPTSNQAPLLPGPRPFAPDLGQAPGAAPSVGRPAPDPLDPRDVDVSAFWIDLTEVTQAQYAAFLADTGYRPPYVDEPWADDGWSWDGPDAPAATADHPVVLTNWYDAREYCAWAGKRLPTEAEWQLAALGPANDERLFPWGDDYDGARLNHGTIDPPNYDDSDGFERTSPVGSFPSGASRFGLLDAFGNAWEWTADLRVATWNQMLGERRGDRLANPHTGTLGLYAAVRGGAYFFDLRPNPGGERSAFLMELRRKTSGFRCAKDAK